MSEPATGGLRPSLALAFAAVAFVALVIFGFGVTSLALSEDVLSTPGIGQAAGVVGLIAATVAFIVVLWTALRRPHPSFTASWAVGAGVFLSYLVGVWLGAVVFGADPALALSAVGSFATSWFAVVLVAMALIASWGGIALVRTRAGRPRWPWENEDD